MHAIVPPYLLARIAAVREPEFQHAAAAARATLAAPRPYHPGRSSLELSIDESGALVAEAVPAPDRTIFDAKNRETLPGVRVRGEDDPPSGDASVDEAFDGLGATFDFYWDAYQRNGIDGAGGALLATVHYGKDYDNAFWNGERMVFGDGDDEVFTGFTNSLTVIAHELTHGVTEHEGGLVYQGQSGALNESISDVFGCLTEQHLRGQTADEAELAGRRRDLHGCRAGPCPPLDDRAGHRLRRRRARPRPAARGHERLRRDERRQRRRAHQLRHPEPRLRPRRRRAGRARVGAGRTGLVPHAHVGHALAHRGLRSLRRSHDRAPPRRSSVPPPPR